MAINSYHDLEICNGTEYRNDIRHLQRMLFALRRKLKESIEAYV